MNTMQPFPSTPFKRMWTTIASPRLPFNKPTTHFATLSLRSIMPKSRQSRRNTRFDATRHGLSETMPRPSETMPGRSKARHGRSETMPRPSKTMPDARQTRHGRRETMPGQSKTMPGRRQTRHGRGQTMPGRRQTMPDSSETMPRPSKRRLMSILWKPRCLFRRWIVTL